MQKHIKVHMSKRALLLRFCIQAIDSQMNVRLWVATDHSFFIHTLFSHSRSAMRREGSISILAMFFDRSGMLNS